MSFRRVAVQNIFPHGGATEGREVADMRVGHLESRRYSQSFRLLAAEDYRYKSGQVATPKALTRSDPDRYGGTPQTIIHLDLCMDGLINLQCG